MKKILIFLLVFASCRNDNEKNAMYYKLLIYRNDLKSYVNDVRDHLSNKYEENSFLKNRYDSLNAIQENFQKQYEKNKFGNRTLLINIRNEFNEKHNLGLKFDQSNYDKNIHDTVFNRLLEIDFLTLQKEFIDRKMILHGCK